MLITQNAKSYTTDFLRSELREQEAILWQLHV